MKYLYVLLLIVLRLFAAFPHNSIKIDKYYDWHVDNHGNIFINTGNSIIKYDKDGSKLCQWIPGKASNIASFDASNNLRVVVFFQESYQISVLDKNLFEIAEPFDLMVTGINDITKVCRSVGEGIWVADLRTNTIYELQRNLRINYSFSFNKYGHISEIKKMLNYNQQLWFLMTDNSWLVLDPFGQYLTKHNQKGLEKSQISKQIVHFIDDGNLFSYDIKLKDSRKIASNLVSSKGCFIYIDTLYLFEDDTITVRHVRDINSDLNIENSLKVNNN